METGIPNTSNKTAWLYRKTRWSLLLQLHICKRRHLIKLQLNHFGSAVERACVQLRLRKRLMIPNCRGSLEIIITISIQLLDSTEFLQAPGRNKRLLMGKIVYFAGIDETVEAVRATGGTCVGYKVDISKKEEVYKSADAIRHDVGDVSTRGSVESWRI